MQHKLTLRLLPSVSADDQSVKKEIARAMGIKESSITGFRVLKRSIDARGKTTWINLTVHVFIEEPCVARTTVSTDWKDIAKAARTVIVIGAGPAGLFAALQLIARGIRPVILERGKDVKSRRRDLARLNKEGIVNPESNYCFGEGGAGTYSDGKLYTRSNKRGNIDHILGLFVQFGAAENIVYESHPHIGTNKLPQIITAMREHILACGGKFLFEKKVVDLLIKEERVQTVLTSDGDRFTADAVILATGHSARDIFKLLQSKNLLIEAKPFALGVRIEHPQSIIDNIQYHSTKLQPGLPPASYSLVEQIDGKAVFSFCMCPGGIIAPAATSPGELVVNGWSPSKRNNPYANSGMVVQVEKADLVSNNRQALTDDALLMMHFQQAVEQDSFNAGGGGFVAPAQRMVDFCEGNLSVTLPPCSYLPGLRAVSLDEVLPGFIYTALRKGFAAFGKKMKGYFSNEAVIVAAETRTSSPVRIPRNAVTMTHPQLNNFYPCGEGAGYAGGIVSAAMDGERIANRIADVLNK